jgi:predicted ArsR family transcriptional regulator
VQTERPGIAVVGSLGDPVRRRLYEYVSGRGEPVAREEAAQAAGIGRPLAAYHLDKLVHLGLLTASYRRPPGRRGPGAGRPAKVYTRSESEFSVTVPPRDYELAARLLAEAVAADESGASADALARAARRLGADLGRRSLSAAGGTPAAGAEAARRALDAALREHGFEPDRAGDQVLLRNCPFHQLVTRHPGIVCGMNQALLEGLVAGLGADDVRAVLEPGERRCCVVITGRQLASGTPRTGAT